MLQPDVNSFTLGRRMGRVGVPQSQHQEPEEVDRHDAAGRRHRVPPLVSENAERVRHIHDAWLA